MQLFVGKNGVEKGEVDVSVLFLFEEVGVLAEVVGGGVFEDKYAFGVQYICV